MYAACGRYVYDMWIIVCLHVYLYNMLGRHFVENLKGVFSICDRYLQMGSLVSQEPLGCWKRSCLGKVVMNTKSGFKRQLGQIHPSYYCWVDGLLTIGFPEYPLIRPAIKPLILGGVGWLAMIILLTNKFSKLLVVVKNPVECWSKLQVNFSTNMRRHLRDNFLSPQLHHPYSMPGFFRLKTKCASQRILKMIFVPKNRFQLLVVSRVLAV